MNTSKTICVQFGQINITHMHFTTNWQVYGQQTPNTLGVTIGRKRNSTYKQHN